MLVHLDLCRSSLKLKVIGQSSISQEKNVPFSAMAACSEWEPSAAEWYTEQCKQLSDLVTGDTWPQPQTDFSLPHQHQRCLLLLMPVQAVMLVTALLLQDSQHHQPLDTGQCHRSPVPTRRSRYLPQRSNHRQHGDLLWCSWLVLNVLPSIQPVTTTPHVMQTGHTDDNATVHCRLHPRHPLHEASASLSALRHLWHDATNWTNTTQRGR